MTKSQADQENRLENKRPETGAKWANDTTLDSDCYGTDSKQPENTKSIHVITP